MRDAVSIADVKATVQGVAACVRDRQAFGRLASAAAEELGPASIPLLRTLYHGDPCPPSEYEEQFPGLGAWLSARQFAVFEIYFFLGLPALPELMRVAFGDYDWIQGNAIEVLCRLAASGHERERIIAKLKEHLPEMREEAHFYAIGPLLSSEMPSIAEILAELRRVPEFESSYQYMINKSSSPTSTAAPPVPSPVPPSLAKVAKKPWWKVS